ncbi:MAG TPA: phosphatidylcholine/phosphatidylserine synthase [Pyrinomonadaceae bacterium]|nr:phosphatidylcholine/phosphatidylserine synthase [Pyrinomonadaceae bacterium]
METEEPKTVHRGIKKGLYVIPTAFTAANVAMGFLAVLYSIRGFQVVVSNPEAASGYFDYAAIAIGLAILFDTLDGRVARMTKTATEIGVQFDSLADVLTFGIAPIALVYSWAIGASFNENSSAHAFGVFLLFMYLMCGAFRLARFNLQATRPRVLQEGTPKVDKKNFVGLPIPPAAGLMAALVHFAPLPLNSYGEGLAHFYSYLVMILLAVLGILMVSTLRYSSMKTVGTGRRNLYLVLVVAAIGMLMWLYSQYVLLILSVGYVSHGILWYLVNMIRPRHHPDGDDQPDERSSPKQ